MTRAEHTTFVCKAHTLTLKDLRSWCKERRYVAARRELWHRLLVVTWADQVLAGIEPKVPSRPAAGRYLRKDASTVLYAVRRFSAEHYGTGPKARLAEMRAAYLSALSNINAQERAA